MPAISLAAFTGVQHFVAPTLYLAKGASAPTMAVLFLWTGIGIAGAIGGIFTVRRYKATHSEGYYEQTIEQMVEQESERAERIVRAYGICIMQHSDAVNNEPDLSLRIAKFQVYPESGLPYSKQEIRSAIKFVFASGRQEPDLVDSLAHGYAELARYIPDREAATIYRERNLPPEVEERIRADQDVLIDELCSYLNTLPQYGEDSTGSQRQIDEN